MAAKSTKRCATRLKMRWRHLGLAMWEQTLWEWRKPRISPAIRGLRHSHKRVTLQNKIRRQRPPTVRKQLSILERTRIDQSPLATASMTSAHCGKRRPPPRPARQANYPHPKAIGHWVVP